MFKGALLDLGGVVFTGDAPLPGAVDAIARLRGSGMGLRFVTNITRQPRRSVIAQLAQLDIGADETEVFTPAIAARAWLAAQNLTPHLLVHPALAEDFAGLSSGTADAVVIGDAGQDFTYDALNQAFRLLAAGAPLFALARNRAFRDSDGGLSLDAGPFVVALEYAAGRQARVFGKPAPDFFLGAVDSIGCSPGEAVMVGDDAESDVAGAITAGLKAVLVRTGKYEPGAEHAYPPPPTHLADDLAAATDWILSRR
ncbi:MAG TPA: TIGR01458 family HAD-type hydrolase [Rhizomicrobium sp.]|jgi:HAD superfamily hydrolase (TIGR01458 family)|nr:TIGR01458 family HAD-type hydrolase [Rhizomicrobium sp.]